MEPKPEPKVVEDFLREQAEFMLEHARKDIEAGKDVWPKCHVVGADRGVSVMLIDPAMMATSAEKNALRAKIQTVCKQVRAVGLVFMSDTWIATMDDKQRHKRRVLEEMRNQDGDSRAGGRRPVPAA